MYLYADTPDVASLEEIRLLLGHYAPKVIRDGWREVVLPHSTGPSSTYYRSLEAPRHAVSEEITFILWRKPCRSGPIDLGVWGSAKLALRYPVDQMLVTYLNRKSIYPVFRGLDVEIENSSLKGISIILEDLENVFSQALAGEERELAIGDLYYLTECLIDGSAELVEKVEGEFHFEWKGWAMREHADPFSEVRSLISTAQRDRQAG